MELTQKEKEEILLNNEQLRLRLKTVDNENKTISEERVSLRNDLEGSNKKNTNTERCLFDKEEMILELTQTNEKLQKQMQSEIFELEHEKSLILKDLDKTKYV